MSKLTFTRARSILIALFVGGLFLQIVFTFVVFARDEIWQSTVQALVLAHLATYSVPLGSIAGGVFARKASTQMRVSPLAFGLALTLSTIWNLLLIGRTVLFAIRPGGDDPTAYMDYLKAVATGGAFLTAGSLTFFFSQPE
ncbi:MAG: hypothetical protein ACJ8GN_21055 [Longimicrobiaceae bacterium]